MAPRLAGPLLAAIALGASGAALPGLVSVLPAEAPAFLAQARHPTVAGLLGLAGPALALPAVEVPGLPAAVALAYAAYGLPGPTAEQGRSMATQAAALPPGVAPAAAALLAALASHVAGDRGSALRIALAADAAVDALRGAPAVGGAGILFRDPYDLVLIGGAGADTYAGNRLGDLGPAAGIEPQANLLTLDLGGDDLYLNDAGGAATPGQQLCPFLACGNGLAAAASLDLAGDDTYLAQRSFPGQALVALQGAAAYGAMGLLVDLAGSDAYLVDVSVAVGGAMLQAQGAGFYASVGVLLDAGGDDAYLAEVRMDGANLPQQHVHGAASYQGLGVLADAAGADRYEAMQYLRSGFAIQVAQGAGVVSGVGLALDGGGPDVRIAVQEVEGGFADQHVQGVAEADGTGWLVDAGGDDAYEARIVPHALAGSGHIRQARVNVHGLAVLLDAGGTDSYSEAHAGDGRTWTNGTLALGLDLALP